MVHHDFGKPVSEPTAEDAVVLPHQEVVDKVHDGVGPFELDAGAIVAFVDRTEAFNPLL